MSKQKPRTVKALVTAILDELEREYIPPYGDDEEWMVQQMIESFLKSLPESGKEEPGPKAGAVFAPAAARVGNRKPGNIRED